MHHCVLPPRPRRRTVFGAGYTHLLKVDDDTYVRIDRVLRAVADPLDDAGQPVLQWEMEHAAGVGGTLAAAQAAGAAAAAHGPAGGVGSVGALLTAASAGGLPATRQQLLEFAGRAGRPMHTDGILLYNMTEAVQSAGAAAGEVC